ncbi:uncharacterized protein EV154DRAFT_508393, partial [Mucor mucedo]
LSPLAIIFLVVVSYKIEVRYSFPNLFLKRNLSKKENTRIKSVNLMSTNLSLNFILLLMATAVEVIKS